MHFQSIFVFRYKCFLRYSTKLYSLVLKLLTTYRPPSHHRLLKIWNKNNVKWSYCCMPNIKSIITGHNNNLLFAANNPNRAAVKRCNCRRPDNCPLDGNCCVSSVVYKAASTSSDPTKNYCGCCSTSFKRRYGNQKQSFLHPQKKSATELIKAYGEWKKEEDCKPPNTVLSISRHARSYEGGSRQCYLCLEEKLIILQTDLRLSSKNGLSWLQNAVTVTSSS